MFRRMKANLRELQHFRAAMHAMQERVAGPVSTAYDVRLAFGGISDQRRAAIVAALCAKHDAPSTPPKGDGLLTMTGVVAATGQPLATGALQAVAGFVELLREVDVPLSELAACPVLLELTPNNTVALPAPPKNARERLGYRLGQKAAAMRIAQFDVWERDLRRNGQNTTGQVRGWIDNLDGDLDPLADVVDRMRAAETADAVPTSITGSLPLDFTAENVGSSVGALMLVLRGGADLLAAAPKGATLRLYATIPRAADTGDSTPADPPSLRVIDGGA